MPFELRPYPAPTLRPDGEYLQTAWQRSVYPIAKRLGVEMRLPAVSPQPYTRLAFEGMEFAKDHGAADAYHDGVMRAFFQRSEDIGQLAVLTSVAAEAGLEPSAFREALELHHYRERVAELLRQATDEVQVTGVPLFVIGDVVLRGLQSRQGLEAVIDQQLQSAGI